MMTAPVANSLLDHRFRLDRQIGAGGIGTVFRGSDMETTATVAVKLLQSHADAQDAERFTREAQLLAEIHHRHIVSYVAHGISEHGQPYLVMEWLEGEDLEQHLRRRLPAIAECVSLLRCTSAALAEAHSRGIVHRDLKPSNLFLRGGTMADVVVLDFGLAREKLRGGHLTRIGVIVGTPEYMAPEQARGEQDVGFAADIFSLGCVLYECITGRAPFTGEHLTAILVKVLIEDPPPIETLRSGVPAPLSDMIMRMLHKEPTRRYATGLALHEAVCRLDMTAEEHAAEASATASGVLKLTPQELQFFSVAVAVMGASESSAPPVLPEALREVLRGLGFGVELLADHSLVATVPPSASAVDQALRAARCGLIVKKYLPEAEVAVATGRGRLHGHMPIGEAVDRAFDLLDPHDNAASSLDTQPSTGVWLDALSENLLSGRLDIAHRGGRPQLLAEQRSSPREEPRRLLGQPTPFVGRERKIGILDYALATCIEDSVARAVGVQGPPGFGKSRLRQEFVRHATQTYPQLTVMLGRGDLMHVGASYGMLRDALRGLCGLVGDEAEPVQEKLLRERLGRHLTDTPEDNARVIHFLGEMCGLSLAPDRDRDLTAARRDPKLMLDQVTQAFLQWLRCECRQAPVLLVLEDLHWGDLLTAQLMIMALDELAELPLLILALGRPEVHEMFPVFWSSRYIQDLPLRPLSRGAAQRLAYEVLGRALGEVDPAIVERIVDQGAGHPLFLEELIRSVAERRGDALPETVLAMLLARLSQLDTAARLTLRAASVFGETFTSASIAALLPVDATVRDLQSSLAALIRAEYIEEQREGREAGAERYKFRHALVRDAAYSLLTDENRVTAHRLAGGFLERTGAEPAVLAEHAVRGAEPERAAQFFVMAARQALGRHDAELTQRYTQRALDCGVTDYQHGVIRTMQAWTCQTRMDLATGYALGLEAVDSLPPGSYWWAKSLGICFYSFFMINRFEHIERLIHAFMAATPEPDARVAYLEAGLALSVFLTNVGQRRAAADAIAKMRQASADLELHEHGYLLLADTYRTCKLEPDVFRALGCARQALELIANNGRSFIEVMAHFYLGVALTAIGDVEAGEHLLREASTMSVRIHEEFGTVVTHLTLGLNLVGQASAAKRREAREIAAAYVNVAHAGPAMHGLCHHILGQALLAEGNPADAESELLTALADLSELPPSRLLIVPLLVEAQLRQQRVTEARALAEESLLLITALGGLGQCELPVRLAVVLARLADGDQDGASQALAAAHAELQLRAAAIADMSLRQLFLDIPEHRQLAALSAK